MRKLSPETLGNLLKSKICWNYDSRPGNVVSRVCCLNNEATESIFDVMTLCAKALAFFALTDFAVLSSYHSLQVRRDHQTGILSGVTSP